MEADKFFCKVLGQVMEEVIVSREATPHAGAVSMDTVFAAASSGSRGTAILELYWCDDVAHLSIPTALSRTQRSPVLLERWVFACDSEELSRGSYGRYGATGASEPHEHDIYPHAAALLIRSVFLQAHMLAAYHLALSTNDFVSAPRIAYYVHFVHSACEGMQGGVCGEQCTSNGSGSDYGGGCGDGHDSVERVTVDLPQAKLTGTRSLAISVRHITERGLYTHPNARMGEFLQAPELDAFARLVGRNTRRRNKSTESKVVVDGRLATRLYNFASGAPSIVSISRSRQPNSSSPLELLTRAPVDVDDVVSGAGSYAMVPPPSQLSSTDSFESIALFSDGSLSCLTLDGEKESEIGDDEDKDENKEEVQDGAMYEGESKIDSASSVGVEALILSLEAELAQLRLAVHLDPSWR